MEADDHSVEGRPLGDRELVTAARRGDTDAYEELVRRHQAVAYRVAYLLTGASGEAEDAVQDGFVKAFYALDRFREEAPFRPWLLRIVANEAKNRLRSGGRRAGLELRVVEDRSSAGAAPSPEAAVLDTERSAELMAALGRLSERDRLVVAYRYFFDMSERDMAVALGVRPGTVKSRLARALGRLRKELEEQ